MELRTVIIKKEVELEALKQGLSESDPSIIRLEREIAASRRRLQQEVESSVEKYNKQFGLTRVAAEVVFNQQLYSSLVAKHEELKAQHIMQNQTSEIIEIAATPLHRSSPKRAMILVLGATLGIFFGLGLTLFREYLDDSMHTVKDVRGDIAIPVLGRIPRLSRAGFGFGWRRKASENDALINYETSSWNRKARELYKESYRALQLELMTAANEEVGNDAAEQRQGGLTLLVTSSRPGEGKSVVAANLAISIAQTGWKVLLVDANRRTSVHHELLGTDAEMGLMDMLVGDAAWDDVVKETPLDNLYMVTCGEGNGQADLSGLLISARFGDFIRLSKENFNIVIFDSSPVVLTSESAAIGSKVDGIVLVIKADSTQKDTILQAKDRMQSSGGKILGAVLNCAAAKNYG